MEQRTNLWAVCSPWTYLGVFVGMEAGMERGWTTNGSINWYILCQGMKAAGKEIQVRWARGVLSCSPPLTSAAAKWDSFAYDSSLRPMALSPKLRSLVVLDGTAFPPVTHSAHWLHLCRALAFSPTTPSLQLPRITLSTYSAHKFLPLTGGIQTKTKDAGGVVNQ